MDSDNSFYNDLKDKEYDSKVKEFINRHIEYIYDIKHRNNINIDDKNLKKLHEI